MAFTPKNWVNGSGGGTPVNDTGLEDLETRVTAYPDGRLSANGKGVVNHGSNASTARPTGWASIEWIGSVEPTNAVNGDTWVDTSA